VREQVEQRVSELKAEQRKGQQMLAEVEAKQAELRQTLLRISGAIQVLEELLANGAGPAQQDNLVPSGFHDRAQKGAGNDG
jgi:prefoldin subunit 5